MVENFEKCLEECTKIDDKIIKDKVKTLERKKWKKENRRTEETWPIVVTTWYVAYFPVVARTTSVITHAESTMET